jgi:uncharacterized protein YecT (DUF1311 family)
MKTLVKTAFVIILLAPWPRTHGQSVSDPCVDGTSPQQLACAEREFRSASGQLKQARTDLYIVLEPRSRVKLRAAERLWLRYRKSNCEAEASIYEGGTIQPLVELRCMARVTRERAAELKAQSQTLSGTNENED